MAVLWIGNKERGRIHNMLVKGSTGLFAAAFCGAVSAQEISYDYIEVSWVFADELESEVIPGVIGGAADVDTGVFFEGSGEFFKQAFLRVSGQSLKMDTDTQFGSTGLSTFSVGIGGYFPLGQMFGNMQQALDFTGEVSYERLHFLDETDGWGVTVGARWQPFDQLELNGNVGWRDYGTFLGDDLEDWVYQLGLVFNLTEQIAITGDWEFWDLELGDGDFDLNTFRIGARWNF